MVDEYLIIGVDEAGRGALAGPLYVAAVAGLKANLKKAQDSKSLNPKKRMELYKYISKNAKQIGVGKISASQIDKYGLAAALTRAARDAISQISKQNIPIIIDGPYDFLKLTDRQVTTLVHADAKVTQVSAASIVAKVLRDEYMIKISSKFPNWSFHKNFGYGTAHHMEILKKIKPTPLHRQSFKPVYVSR